MLRTPLWSMPVWRLSFCGTVQEPKRHLIICWWGYPRWSNPRFPRRPKLDRRVNPIGAPVFWGTRGARSRADSSRFSFDQGDAVSLPYETASFDATVRRLACRAPAFPTRRPRQRHLPCRRSPAGPCPRLVTGSAIRWSAWPARLRWRGGSTGCEPYRSRTLGADQGDGANKGTDPCGQRRACREVAFPRQRRSPGGADGGRR